VFRVTEGLLDAFGETRVMDTPLAEAGIVGFSVGMALYGLKLVCELQFSGFSYLAMHQFESHAARLRWRSRGRYTVPMVARMPYGGGVRALEHHSESREAYYAHTPGLKMVIPSGPRTARALLVSAIRDPDPVIFFEPKLIYRAFREEVPEAEETLPIGISQVVREGNDLTMIAYGAMLRRTLEAAAQLAEEDGVEAEVIDLLTISPLVVVYTDPQIAWCGLTEPEAQTQKLNVTVARFPWKASGRAVSMGLTEGFTKLIMDAESQHILGVGMVGAHAEALIAEGALAVEMGALAQDVALTVHPHPILSETIGEAAQALLGSATHVFAQKR
jgi:hypothetical protein